MRLSEDGSVQCCQSIRVLSFQPSSANVKTYVSMQDTLTVFFDAGMFSAGGALGGTRDESDILIKFLEVYAATVT